MSKSVQTLLIVLTLSLSVVACSGGGSDPDDKGTSAEGTCSADTSNAVVSGFSSAPAVISGGTPTVQVGYQEGQTYGLAFTQAGGGASMEMVLLVDSAATQGFKQGDTIALGKAEDSEPTMTIDGYQSSEQVYCNSSSGDAEVDLLSVDASGSVAGLKAASVRFDVACDPRTVMPANVTHVTGCWHYSGT